MGILPELSNDVTKGVGQHSGWSGGSEGPGMALDPAFIFWSFLKVKQWNFTITMEWKVIKCLFMHIQYMFRNLLNNRRICKNSSLWCICTFTRSISSNCTCMHSFGGWFSGCGHWVIANSNCRYWIWISVTWCSINEMLNEMTIFLNMKQVTWNK